MYEFVLFFGDCWSALIQLIARYSFRLGNYEISLWYILLGFIFMGMIISVFWKGAKG